MKQIEQPKSTAGKKEKISEPAYLEIWGIWRAALRLRQKQTAPLIEAISVNWHWCLTESGGKIRIELKGFLKYSSAGPSDALSLIKCNRELRSMKI